MRTSFFAFILWATAAIGSASPVKADNHLNCQAYAETVMQSVRHSIGLGCDFNTAQWVNDYNFHFNWCNQKTTQIHHLGEQQNIRAAQLEQCKAKVKIRDADLRKKQVYCNQYAKQAQKIRAELNNACQGQDGGEWPQDAKADYEFCLAKGGAFADLTNNNRVKQIAACQSTKTYKPKNFRGTPLDGCNENGTSCGQAIADSYCKYNQGHKRAQKFETGGTDFTVYLFCLRMNAAEKQSYLDAGGKCHCSGKSKSDCGYFKSITCEGKR